MLLLFPLLITDLGLMLPFLFIVCVIPSPPPTVTEEGCWKVKAITCRFNPALENTISFIGKAQIWRGEREALWSLVLHLSPGRLKLKF